MTHTGCTADRLQYVAMRLGNGCFCRHWLHWNYPSRDPWLMAVSCLDSEGGRMRAPLEKLGFTRIDHAGLIVYTIPRLDDEGRPFRSKSL